MDRPTFVLRYGTLEPYTGFASYDSVDFEQHLGEG
jgi:hypothetical protein